MLSKKVKPVQQSIDQCVVALHLTSLFVSYFAAHLNAQQIRKQLFLSSDWSSVAAAAVNATSVGRSSAHSAASTTPEKGLGVSHLGDLAVSSILNETICVLSNHPLPVWMYDIG